MFVISEHQWRRVYQHVEGSHCSSDWYEGWLVTEGIRLDPGPEKQDGCTETHGGSTIANIVDKIIHSSDGDGFTDVGQHVFFVIQH